MAIEIKELLIRVQIGEERNQAAQSANLEQLRESLIRECRKEIKRQLKRTKER